MDGIPTVEVTGVPDPLPEELGVLDVREDTEWQQGHIAGARHIPLAELPVRLQEVDADQTLVVCRSGARSAQAVAYLRANGQQAVNLDGGMLDWESAGRAMVCEHDGPPRVV